jgi:hypothetical protein
MTLGPIQFNPKALALFAELGITVDSSRTGPASLVLPDRLKMANGNLGYTQLMEGETYVAAICWFDNDPAGQWGAIRCSEGAIPPGVEQPWPDDLWAELCGGTPLPVPTSTAPIQPPAPDSLWAALGRDASWPPQ